MEVILGAGRQEDEEKLQVFTLLPYNQNAFIYRLYS